jgi:AP endonuclease-1
MSILPKEESSPTTADSPTQSSMQASNAKASHKRNLSNGTPDNSPLRRSKRQRSTANLKEASSGEDSEEEHEVVPTPKKASSALATPKAKAAAKLKKTQVAASVKKEVTEETEIDSGIAVGKKESAVKTEGGDIDVKSEAEAASTIKAKPARKARKTKEEKEAEAMPLAPRTSGLKMFVGAHVSAAKGQYLGLFLGCMVKMLIEASSSRCIQLDHQ